MATKKTKKPSVYKIKDNGKHDTGRPSKYYPGLGQEMIDYFSKPLTDTDKLGKTVLNNFPTFQGFAARVLGVSHQTLLDWTRTYKDFFEAYKTCKALQETLLAEGGLSRAYDSRFAMFIMNSISDTFKEKTTTEVKLDKDTQNIIKLAYSLPTDPKED